MHDELKSTVLCTGILGKKTYLSLTPVLRGRVAG